MFKSKNKKQLGFTLVELLVVIAIIGILSSVAVVNLNSSRDSARKAAALADMKNMQTQAMLCLDSGADLNCNGSACLSIQPTIGQSLCTNSLNSWTWQDLSENGYEYRKMRSNKDTVHFCVEIAKPTAYTEKIVCTENTCFQDSGVANYCNTCTSDGEYCDSDIDCCSYHCGSSNKCDL